MIKWLIGFLIGIAIAGAADANQCFTQTYFINGQTIICTTCGNVTTCF